MQYSDVYSLRKPQMAETASIHDINYNTDRIDSIMRDNRRISVYMYDPADTYNTDDLVGYEDVTTHVIRLYKCLEDGVTGVWDSTKWEITTMAEEVAIARESGGDNANQNIADAYDSTATYAVGDYVIYNSTLYKCVVAVTTAEAFDADKWTAVVVTDEMGQGGGGGSSTLAGLSDVNLSTPSQGQALVYDGSEWVNGASSGGGGAFIDTENVITTLHGSGSGADFQTWTAIDNCYVVGAVVGDSAAVQIDGVTVAYTSDRSESIGVMVPVRKGQIVGYRINSSSVLTVYGITYTTQNLQPIIYSTEEREVGVWTDGKPLYQKTYRLSSAVIITANTWANLGIDGTEIDIIVNKEVLDDEDRSTTVDYCAVRSGYLNVLTVRATNVQTITIQYTKTTDTAGSGTWTPSGVPAVHYSTDEQVVGTWIDGSTVYEITLVGTVANTTAYTAITPSWWTDLNISEVLSITGTVSTSDGDTTPLGTYRPGTTWQMWFMASSATVAYQQGGSYSNGKYRATIQYTKATS